VQHLSIVRRKRSREIPEPTSEITFKESARLLEIACWTILALVPVLRWINGPAVSADQFVIQVTIACAAALIATRLRLYNRRGH